MTDPTALIIPDPEVRAVVGAWADETAARHVFGDYRLRQSQNSLRRQRADLTALARFLSTLGMVTDADALQREPESWRGITWGLVAAFVRWQLGEGYAIGSVNVRLATVKTYAKLATQAGTLSAEQNALIRLVKGYAHKEVARVDEQRAEVGLKTRRGVKKAAAIPLSKDQRRALKEQPDTPQGRRDAVLLCLLLDLGLRCGELALLDVTDVNLAESTLTFYRPKVDKVQTLKLTADCKRALQAYFEGGDVPALGLLLRGSRKGGTLTGAGMSARAITARVNALGRQVGIEGLSAHDLRHSWATTAARHKTAVFTLQEAGGWNSLAMPRRYVEAATIANEGVHLGEE